MRPRIRFEVKVFLPDGDLVLPYLARVGERWAVGER